MKSLVIYLLMIIISTSFLAAGIRNKKNINIYIIMGLLILTIFAGGRYYVGTDYRNYLIRFYRASEMQWGDIFKEREILFSSLVKITFSLGGRVLTWSTIAFIMSIVICYTLRSCYSNIHMSVSVLVYISAYYVASFNISRQILAAAFVFLSTKYIFENKPIKYFICIAVATSFHNTAIIAIIMWLIWDQKTNSVRINLKSILLIFILMVLILFNDKIILFITKNVDIFSKYETYMLENTRSFNNIEAKNRDIYLYILEFLIMIIFRKILYKHDNRINFFYILMFISIIISFTGFRSPFIKRSAIYFLLPARIILFGSLPKAFTKRSQFYIEIILIIYLLLLFTMSFYVLGHSDIMPYTFNLEM